MTLIAVKDLIKPDSRDIIDALDPDNRQCEICDKYKPKKEVSQYIVGEEKTYMCNECMRRETGLDESARDPTINRRTR